MTTIHDPLDLICGDTWQFDGPLLDADDCPLNLTGAEISWRLDGLRGGNYIALSLSSSGGISIVNLTRAEILVSAPPSLTSQLAPGVYRDWLRVTLSDGTVLTMWSGIIRAVAGPS
jgi:hypothetical protein